MFLIRISYIALCLRRIAATALIGMLFSSPTIAWQNGPDRPYPNYPAPAYNNPYPNYPGQVYYNPYPNYPAPAYANPFPQANYYAPYYYPSQPAYAPQYPAAIPETGHRPAIDKVLKQNTVPKKPASAEDSSPKKQVFINKLLPYIEKENTLLIKTREQARQIIYRLEAQQSIPDQSKIWLKKLARQYRIEGNPVEDPQAREKLLKKVDIIPASLTLAQAANESAWGNSRFATEANNLFGIWTYDENKGLKPQKRDAEKKHLIRKFEDFGESIRYYMHTLNTHPAYKKLRDVRQQLRQKQQNPDGHAMAAGLEKYSAKGDKYVKLIRELIRQNRWSQLDKSNHHPA